MSKITDALAKLDTANDNHWTSDGLPRIETVRMFASDPSISRELITAEAPNLSRSNAVLLIADPVPPAQPISADSVAPVPPADPVPPVVVADPAVGETKGPIIYEADPLVVLASADYDVLIEQAQATLQKAISERNVAQEVVNAAQNELDDLINEKHDSGTSDTNASVIQGYLLSQQNDLTERGRRSKVLQESGVTLRDIQALIPQASPLDRAISSRKK